VSWAGDQDVYPGQTVETRAQKRHRHLCPTCAAKVAAARQAATGQPIPGPVVVQGAPMGGAPCLSCQQSAMGTAPGVAYVGEPMAAPGYAMVGGTMPGAEPAPIGVMRTNYSTHDHTPGSLGASLDPRQAASAGADWGAPGRASVIPAAPTPSSTSHRRPGVIRHLLFGGGPGMREMRSDKRKSQHASISYGSAGSVTELPASLVYGR
jgi:hypothetical protein